MDLPPPYDPRRLPSSSSSLHHPQHPRHHDSSTQNRPSYHLLDHSHVSHSHSHSQPQLLQSSHSTHYPSTTPVYYLTNSSRPTPSESTRHLSSSSSVPQFLYRRPYESGSNPDTTTRKHHRMVDELSGSRSVSGSSDLRDRKRSRVSGRSDSTKSDLRERERNSRSSYDNTVKESSPRHNRRHYDTEKREIRDTDRRTPQKPSAKSRISVWNRIEENPSLVASPSSSNRSNRASVPRVSQEIKPETEASAQSVGPEKEVGPSIKAAEVSAEVTGKKKKKVVIRRRIVKKKGKADNSTISSSSPVDPAVEGLGPDKAPVGKRRVKRVLIVKKKKGAKVPGETSMCNEEIVRQIANQVFSENKSVDGSRLSPEKSATEIESKKDDGKNMSLVSFEKNSSITNGMIGTSHMEICTKEEIVEATSPDKLSVFNGTEPVHEAPSDLETTKENKGKEIAFTVGLPIGKDYLTEENKEREVPIEENHEMTSPTSNYGIGNENIESKMQIDVPRGEETQVNDAITRGKTNGEKDQDVEQMQVDLPKEEEIQVNDAITGEKDQEMKNCPSNESLGYETPREGEPVPVNALTGSGLDTWLQLKPPEMSSSELVLGQYSPQINLDFSSYNSNSSPQAENEGNGVAIFTEINENNVPDQTENSIASNELTGSATNGENVVRAKMMNQEGIHKYQKETQKAVYQKPVSVSHVPKFPVQNPRHKTWRREANDSIAPGFSAPNPLSKPPPKRDTLLQNSYIRKGNSLIRSASGTAVPPKSSVPVPRIPSPNPSPPAPDMTREVTTPVSSPVHESEGEDQKGLEKVGFQNSNNKMVYLKKKNNQIVLNSGVPSDSQNSKGSTPPLENAASTSNSNSDDNRDLVHYSSDSGIMGLIKKSIDKAPRQINRVASYPNVWTLGGMQSKRKGGTGKVTNSFFKSIPSLLPWKRATLLKNSTRKRPILHRSATSWLIRKLVLAKRMDTVYAVSKDGFSLRKTGVLGVGGSSLKWSRSIEKNSKKACEEATLAVAEVERKKREKRKRVSLRNKGKKSTKAPFAIGDKTGDRKRTALNLNRLSTCSGYVRVNKGNQLVRDPKKLVRILASEKVQRSLHTLRNAKRKKQQYCLFYTRFGRCNKTKCTYIHDPAKIAICTKFLRGFCVNTNCKLTHQIIPERMPDCSYFLQGLCTNLTCPYRHVNVNPKAPVCEGFLRGYCADGDECRKKHRYTCPEFEATGKCLLGPKCKLYHPKIKSKSKKRKVTLLQKSGSRPRYFESSIGATGAINSEKNCDDLFSRGLFGDFISLISGRDEDGSGTSVDAFDLEMVRSDPDSSDLEVDDELIKPVRVMRRAGLMTVS